jgi:hypothetical protein
MDIKLVISNVAAAAGLIIFSVAIVTGMVPDDSEGISYLIVGSSLTYLFTENVVNGRGTKPEVIND